MKRSLTTRLYNLSKTAKFTDFTIVIKSNWISGQMFFHCNRPKQRRSKVHAVINEMYCPSCIWRPFLLQWVMVWMETRFVQLQACQPSIWKRFTWTAIKICPWRSVFPVLHRQCNYKTFSCCKLATKWVLQQYCSLKESKNSTEEVRAMISVSPVQWLKQMLDTVMSAEL